MKVKVTDEIFVVGMLRASMWQRDDCNLTEQLKGEHIFNFQLV